MTAMNPALVDVLDWVEEMRRSLLDNPSRTKLSTPPGPKPFFDWAACGTAAQYRKHLRHGQQPCAACRAAESRRQADARIRRLARRRQLYAERKDWRTSFNQMISDVNDDLRGQAWRVYR